MFAVGVTCKLLVALYTVFAFLAHIGHPEGDKQGGARAGQLRHDRRELRRRGACPQDETEVRFTSET
jgi:hypothetical protein